jgi:hypothetical protein
LLEREYSKIFETKLPNIKHVFAGKETHRKLNENDLIECIFSNQHVSIHRSLTFRQRETAEGKNMEEGLEV